MDCIMNVPRMNRTIWFLGIFLAVLCCSNSLRAQEIYCSGLESVSIEYGDSVGFQIEVLAYDAPTGASVSASYGAMTGNDSDFEILTPNFYTSESGRGPGYGYCSVRFRPTKNYPDSVAGFVTFSSNAGTCAVEVIGYIIHSTVGGYDSMATEYFASVSWGTWRTPERFSIFSARNEAQKVTFKITGQDDTLFSITPDTLYLKKHGEASGTITYMGSYIPIVYDTLNITYHSTIDSSDVIEKMPLIDSTAYTSCLGDASDFGSAEVLYLPIAHDTLLTFRFANGADTPIKIESLDMHSFDDSEFGPLQLKDSMIYPGSANRFNGPIDTCLCLFHPDLRRILEIDRYNSESNINFRALCEPSDLLTCPTLYSSHKAWPAFFDPTTGDTENGIGENWYPPLAFETDLDSTIVQCNFVFVKDTGVFIPGAIPLGVSLEDSSHFKILSFDTAAVTYSQWESGIKVHLEIALIAPTEGTYSTYLLGHFQTGDSRSELAAYRTAKSSVRTIPQLSDISIASDGTNRLSISTNEAISLDCYDILGRLIVHRELQDGNTEIILPDAAKGTIFCRFSRSTGSGKKIVETRKVLIE